MEYYTKQTSKPPSVLSWNLCIRESLCIQIVHGWEEKITVLGKVSGQYALSLSKFSIFFSCLVTHPHITTTAHGGQHQPTVLASRVLWGNVNQQKEIYPGADIRNKLEGLGVQQKRGKNVAGPWKIYHLQYVRSSAPISAVIYCPQLCQNLMKNTDLRSYIFLSCLFSFWHYQAFAFWFGKLCDVFKNPL